MKQAAKPPRPGARNDSGNGGRGGRGGRGSGAGGRGAPNSRGGGQAQMSKKEYLELLAREAEENTRILERERAKLLAMEIQNAEKASGPIPNHMRGVPPAPMQPPPSHPRQQGGRGAPPPHAPPHARRNPRLLVELAPSLEATEATDPARQTPLSHFYDAELGPEPDQGLATFPPTPQSDLESSRVANQADLPRFENYGGPQHQGPPDPFADRNRGVDLVSWMGPPSPGRTLHANATVQYPGQQGAPQQGQGQGGLHTFNFHRGAPRLETGVSPRPVDLPAYHHMKSSVPFGAPEAPTPIGGAAPPGGKPQFMSALSQLHGGPTMDEARRREEARLQYQRELEQQIREKKEREARERAMRDADDLRLEREIVEYNARQMQAGPPEKAGRNQQGRGGSHNGNPPPQTAPANRMPGRPNLSVPPPPPEPSYQDLASPPRGNYEALPNSPRRKPGIPPPDTLNLNTRSLQPIPMQTLPQADPNSPGNKRGYLAGLSELKPGLSDEQRRHAEVQRQQLVRDLEEQVREKKAREEARRAQEREREAREEAEIRAYYERQRQAMEQGPSKGTGRVAGIAAPAAPAPGRRDRPQEDGPFGPHPSENILSQVKRPAPPPAREPSNPNLRGRSTQGGGEPLLSKAGPSGRQSVTFTNNAPSIDAWLDEGAQPSTARSALTHHAEMVPVSGPQGRRGDLSRRSIASEASDPGTGARRDKSTSGRSSVHPEVTHLLRELRHEQEVLREQLESHAAAMERVQAEADAARRERDLARAELERVQVNLGLAESDSLDEFMVESRLVRKSLDFIPDYIDERIAFRTSKSDSLLHGVGANPQRQQGAGPPAPRRGWARGGITELPSFAEEDDEDLDGPRTPAQPQGRRVRAAGRPGELLPRTVRDEDDYAVYGENVSPIRNQARKRPPVQGRRAIPPSMIAAAPKSPLGAKKNGVGAGGQAPARWKR